METSPHAAHAQGTGLKTRLADAPCCISAEGHVSLGGLSCVTTSDIKSPERRSHEPDGIAAGAHRGRPRCGCRAGRPQYLIAQALSDAVSRSPSFPPQRGHLPRHPDDPTRSNGDIINIDICH